MDQRMDFAQTAPEAYQALAALDRHVRAHVDGTVLELVKLRASCWNQKRAPGPSRKSLALPPSVHRTCPVGRSTRYSADVSRAESSTRPPGSAWIALRWKTS